MSNIFLFTIFWEFTLTSKAYGKDMVTGMVTIWVPKMQHYEEVAKEQFFWCHWIVAVKVLKMRCYRWEIGSFIG